MNGEAVPLAAALAIMLLGPAAGSFAALLAERLLRGEPVALERSRCRRCNQVLGWRELVPIWSWLWQKGRCAQCGAPIPPALLQAELAGLGLGLGAVLAAPDTATALAGATFLWCLLALALADLRRYRLPDALNAALLLLGLALALAGSGAGAAAASPGGRLAASLVGALVGGGVFWALRAGYSAMTGREGMGAGDVKLMAGIGAGLGAPALPMVALLAGLSGLALAWWRARRRGRKLSRTARVPFGALLAAAAAAVWLLPGL
ncbi:MAG: prepilin peptidase [Pararhodobacter sp.]|nr:prepilin peptidase [Pararhodobacter sp.]